MRVGLLPDVFTLVLQQEVFRLEPITRERSTISPQELDEGEGEGGGMIEFKMEKGAIKTSKDE